MKLEAYLEIVAELKELYYDEVTVTLYDKEKIIAYYPGPSLDFRVRVGEFPKPGSNAAEVLRTGQKVVRYVPKDVFGIPYIGICWPICEQGELVGCLAVATSLERFDALTQAGQEISSALEQLAASAQSLSAASQQLASTVQNMDRETEEVRDQVQRTSRVSDRIKKLAVESNILGLNAAIQASHAGAHGRAFSVVADEVRKLADNTKLSTREISENLQRVNILVNDLVDSIQQLAKVAETQALSTGELAQAVNQIARMAERLVDLGKVN